MEFGRCLLIVLFVGMLVLSGTVNSLTFDGKLLNNGIKIIDNPKIATGTLPGTLPETLSKTQINDQDHTDMSGVISDDRYIRINGVDVRQIDMFSPSSLKKYRALRLDRRYDLESLSYKTVYYSTIDLSDEVDGYITSLLICGNITTFNHGMNNGFARVLLLGEDKEGNLHVYSVFDSTLLYNSGYVDKGVNRITFCNVGEETLSLPESIKPVKLIVEGSNSHVMLNYLRYSSAGTTALGLRSHEYYLDKQNEIKVEMVNKRNKEYNYPWRAGDTKVSSFSYEKKLGLYGIKRFDRLLNIDDDRVYEYTVNGERIKERLAHGQTSDEYVPLLRAQEEIIYYKSGLFTPFSINMSYEEFMTSIEDSDYVIGYSWRTAHGENWLTPVKDQGSCGSCWAFGTIGALESYINLYYNQHIDVNLSEQDLVSCSGAGGCYGGNYPDAYDYIQSTGVVDEECFPYTESDAPCSDKCSDWSSRVWKITGHSDVVFVDYYIDRLDPNVVNYYRNITSNGPLTTGIDWWNHVITGVGFKIFTNYGINALEVKNSWGDWWGHDGYGYILQFSEFDFITIDGLIPPSGTAYTKECRDSDGDGYCWWGVGEKPSTCPSSCAGNDVEDCDDSDPEKNGFVDGYMCIKNQYKIDSCKVISTPGTYFVTQDISSSSPVCIDVQSDDVVILGRGYKITGSGTGTGIRINGHSDVHIKNIILDNFDTGVDIDSSTNVVIKYLIINRSNTGIDIYNSDSNRFKMNKVLNCDEGIKVVDSNNNRFEGNYVKSSVIDSLYVEGSSDNEFYYNTFCGGTVDVNVVSGTNQFNGTVCSSSSGSVCVHGCSEDYDCVNLYWFDSYPDGLSFDKGTFTHESGSLELCNITYYFDKDNRLIFWTPSPETLDCNGATITSDFNTYPYDTSSEDNLGYGDVGEIVMSQGTIRNCNFVNLPTPITQLGTRTELFIENNRFENISGCGIAIHMRWANFVIRNNTFKNVVVDDPDLYYEGYGVIHIDGLTDMFFSPNLIANNTFFNCTPITSGNLDYWLRYSPLHIVNNTFSNATTVSYSTYSIYLRYINNLVIANNRFFNNSWIKVRDTSNSNISNNLFTTPTGTSTCIKFFDGANSLIYNNTFICSSGSCPVWGIYLKDSYNNNVSSNYIESLDRGIYLRYSDNNDVEDNIILNSGSYGVYMSSSSSNHVRNNIICGSATYDIKESGSNEYTDNYCETSDPAGLCTATRTYYYDGDSDTYGGETTMDGHCPSPGYTWRSGDCNDSNPDIHPGAEEVCDGLDNDCNGYADDGLPTYTYYPDSDGDTFGDPASPYTTCYSTPPTGYVIDNTDCNDTNADIHPGATEVCNEYDDNCDGNINEGFDSDGDTYTICGYSTLDGSFTGVDCNDTNADINPGATEICNEYDDNCDGNINEGFDSDGDTYTICGYSTLDGSFTGVDCNDTNATVYPGAEEVCDGVDQDCDGLFDEDFDSDGDGYTTCGYNITTGEYIEPDCLDDPSGDPPGCPTDPSGCDPGCPSDGTSACAICVNPAHTTECCGDSVDNNCDGLLDEEDPDCIPLGIDIMDMDGDGYNVYVDCDDLDPTVHPGAFDRANGRDDDCDGLVDEDVRPGLKPGYPYDKLPVRVVPGFCIPKNLVRGG